MAKAGQTGRPRRANELAMAKGKYVVLLDDRCYPVPGSIGRMVDYLEANDRLAAAVYSVTRQDGWAGARWTKPRRFQDL